MTPHIPLTHPEQAMFDRIRRWKLTATYRGYPAIVHVNTVDEGTVEINAPAGEIWQKRIRVNVDELTNKQIVTA